MSRFKTALLEYLEKNNAEFFDSKYSDDYLKAADVRALDSDAKDFYNEFADLIGGKVELYSTDIETKQRLIKISDAMEKMSKDTGIVSMEFVQDFGADGWLTDKPKTSVKIDLLNGETMELNLGNYKMGTKATKNAYSKKVMDKLAKASKSSK